MVKNQLNQQLWQEWINSQFKKRIIGVWSRVGQYSKKLISVFLWWSVLWLVLYVWGWKFANHKLPDRKFEQWVKKDQNGSIDSYAV